MDGGCQCGAVRYRITGEVRSANLCHCRMCQRAVGGPFAALMDIARDDVEWTGDAPVVWRSSNVAQRGFCWQCGTPMSFEYMQGDEISLFIATLDSPDAVTPTVNYGVESRRGWLHDALAAPGEETREDGHRAGLKSRQSPAKTSAPAKDATTSDGE